MEEQACTRKIMTFSEKHWECSSCWGTCSLVEWPSVSMEGSYCCSSSHPQCNSHSANSLILAMDALAEEPFVTMRVNFSRGDNPTPDSFLMLLKFLPHYVANILPFVLQIAKSLLKYPQKLFVGFHSRFCVPSLGVLVWVPQISWKGLLSFCISISVLCKQRN